MKNLNDILEGVKLLELVGENDSLISSLELDSRAVKKNSLFAAIKGSQSDGHSFISTAIDKGASFILCEDLPEELLADVVYIKVQSSSKALALMASHFYNKPSSDLKLVAVTGTNGKTSVATLLYQLFTDLGYVCGLLSTVENRISNKIISATHTTPNAVAINALLSEMREASVSYCFMEASSHAIHQDRIYGLNFAGAIFTNLTHDHLDYHKTFKDYLLAKKLLFDQLPSSAFALSNADDKNGRIMLQNTSAAKKYYAITSPADFVGRVLESDVTGMVLNFNMHELHVKQIGAFNAYNLLAVYATALLLDQEETEVLVALSTLKGAEGRFEYCISDKTKVIGIVDYAHTPDALKKVLETISAMNMRRNKIITVVGCGGDRDKTKRPLMAAISAKMSTKLLLTSDNPRTEDPKLILDEMYQGVGVLDKKKVLIIENRREAIRTACMLAEDGDIVLVAGKGHEKYQDIMGVKYPFDDKEELVNAFTELNK